jgi:hypothetical protein
MRVWIRLLAALGILLGGAWCAACLVYGPFPHPAAAAMLAVATLAAAAAVFLPRARPAAWGTFAAALVVFAAFWATVRPSNDRHWAAPVAVLPRVRIDGDVVTIENVRNFLYRTETDFTPRYETRTVRLSELRGVDLVASYWMGDDIAHIFLSFAFGDDDHLAISIETRPEAGESYSTVTGFFRNFEIFYVVADERDLIGVRTNHRQDPPEQVYVYRVQGDVERGRRVFLDYMDRVDALTRKPDWYNTLTTNCTTSILYHTRLNPGHLPLSWKVLASGHVPEYLYENGRLDTSLPFAELKRRSLVNDAARAAGDDAPDFSRRIRAGLPGMGPTPP